MKALSVANVILCFILIVGVAFLAMRMEDAINRIDSLIGQIEARARANELGGIRSKKPKSRENGLVAHYPFDGNANDVSGNGYHGVVHGAGLSEDRFGNADRAYQLDGLNFISLDHKAFDGLGDFTISIWLNFDKLQFKGKRWAVNSILSITTDATREELFFAQGLVSDFFGMNVKGRHYGWHRFHDCKAQAGEWIHVVLVREENKAKLFMNGMLAGTTQVAGEALVTQKDGVVLGHQQQATGKLFEAIDHSLAGRIDDVFIYNRALLEEEVQQLYKLQR